MIVEGKSKKKEATGVDQDFIKKVYRDLS